MIRPALVAQDGTMPTDTKEYERRSRQRALANKYLDEMVAEHRLLSESEFDTRARLALQRGRTGDRYRLLLAVLDDPCNDPNLVE